MTSKINDNRVNEAAMQHYLKVPGMGVVAPANLIKDAFEAGAAWQAEQPILGPEAPTDGAYAGFRLVPHMPTIDYAASHNAIMKAIDCMGDKIDAFKMDREQLNIGNAARYGAMIDRLNAIRDNVAALSNVERNRHDVMTGAMVETQSIIQDVGQKVEAVLSQSVANGDMLDQVHGAVSEPDDVCEAVGDPEGWADKTLPVTDESGVSVGAGSFVIGVDMAEPGSDRTVMAVGVRDGNKVGLVRLPCDDGAGEFRHMLEFKDQLFAVYAFGIYRLVGTRFEPVMFVARPREG